MGYENETVVTSDCTPVSSHFTGKIRWSRSTSAPRTTITSSIARNGGQLPWPAVRPPRRRQVRMMQRNPRWLVDVSTVCRCRAAGR